MKLKNNLTFEDIVNNYYLQIVFYVYEYFYCVNKLMYTCVM